MHIGTIQESSMITLGDFFDGDIEIVHLDVRKASRLETNFTIPSNLKRMFPLKGFRSSSHIDSSSIYVIGGILEDGNTSPNLF